MIVAGPDRQPGGQYQQDGEKDLVIGRGNGSLFGVHKASCLSDFSLILLGNLEVVFAKRQNLCAE